MSAGSTRAEPRQVRTEYVEVIALVLMAVLLSAYALVRYGGRWGETDTRDFTASIRALLDTGQLVPGSQYHVYPNGFGYQALVVFLIELGGVTLSTFQIYGATLLMPWLVIPAWLLYREWTGSNRGATLATAILFVQPEFLFPILRGTHEKFTRGLMLCCLYLLVRSIRSPRRPGRFVGLVLAFDVAALSLNTFNNLFGSSFIAATGLALILTRLALRINRNLSRPTGRVFRRLLYATGTSMILGILFTTYLYPPAHHDLLVVKDVWGRLAALLLNSRTTASNPYAVVSIGWISLPVYIAVSIADWILLFGSSAIWISQTIRWLRGGWQRLETDALLLWAFYGAFAFMSALSIVVDVSGALSGNLQQRIYPSFAMVAAPLIATWLLTWKPRHVASRRLVTTSVWAGIGVVAILSTLKATNEPLLSNKWLFYEPGEIYAVSWADANLPGRLLWVGYDERLPTAVDIRTGLRPLSVGLILDRSRTDVRDFLVSDVTRARAVRLAQSLPIQADDFVTFDDGQTQILHRRPHTPFQR
jgi:hypothetical protein